MNKELCKEKIQMALEVKKASEHFCHFVKNEERPPIDMIIELCDVIEEVGRYALDLSEREKLLRDISAKNSILALDLLEEKNTLSNAVQDSVDVIDMCIELISNPSTEIDFLDERNLKLLEGIFGLSARGK